MMLDSTGPVCVLLLVMSAICWRPFPLVTQVVGSRLKSCAEVYRTPSPQFELVETCGRSKMAPVARSSSSSLQQCRQLTLRKKGLAFNHSPRQNSCLVFDCPEMEGFAALHPDSRYDYHSLYDIDQLTANYSCVPGLGLFRLHHERLNYTLAADACQQEGAVLADVVGETRTNGLSALVSRRGFKRVYVGLSDIELEGRFVTATGAPLNCLEYRAWAPSEPRGRHDSEDCVLLDTGRQWRVRNCSTKLPFLCEKAGRNSSTGTSACSALSSIRDKVECWEEAAKRAPRRRKGGRCPRKPRARTNTTTAM